MIRETKTKINFTSYEPTKGRFKDTSKPPYVIVNKKFGVMLFGKKCLDELQITNQFIKFYYEPTKKIIGWRTTTKLELGQLGGKVWRLVKPNKAGAMSFSVSGILEQFMSLKEDSYKCEVMKYKEQSDVLSRGEETYFVKVGKQYDKTD